tara:strand:+ start:239 stop:355 length:117 start_codon:yes stop_codon:yes gene_type:complete
MALAWEGEIDLSIPCQEMVEKEYSHSPMKEKQEMLKPD